MKDFEILSRRLKFAGFLGPLCPTIIFQDQSQERLQIGRHSRSEEKRIDTIETGKVEGDKV